MRKIIIGIALLALSMGAWAACDLNKPAPTPVPVVDGGNVAPGAYLVATIAGSMTSAQFRSVASDESGTGALLFASHAWQNLGSAVSASVAQVVSDETGTGLVVFNTSPLITTPNLTGNVGVGTVTSGTWNGTSVGFAYMQLTRGVASVTPPALTTTVTHGLGATPKAVLLTFTTLPGASGVYLWSDTYGATTFVINVSPTPSTALTVAWLAVP